MNRTTIVFIVIIGVAVAIALFARFGPGKTTSVTGLVGSEKAPFFADLRVQKALGRHGTGRHGPEGGFRHDRTPGRRRDRARTRRQQSAHTYVSDMNYG